MTYWVLIPAAISIVLWFIKVGKQKAQLELQIRQLKASNKVIDKYQMIVNKKNVQLHIYKAKLADIMPGDMFRQLFKDTDGGDS